MSSVADKSNKSASAPSNVPTKRGRKTRASREERGLPPLTKSQRIAMQIVQGAKNACTYIRESIDGGEMPTGEVLQACSVLQGQLGKYLGRSDT